MIYFLAGLTIGAITGLFTAALLSAGSDADDMSSKAYENEFPVHDFYETRLTNPNSESHLWQEN
ncbi:MAG: hypothetical protein RLN90_09685 [Balneolaceae bacterium]